MGSVCSELNCTGAGSERFLNYRLKASAVDMPFFSPPGEKILLLVTEKTAIRLQSSPQNERNHGMKKIGALPPLLAALLVVNGLSAPSPPNVPEAVMLLITSPLYQPP